MAANKSMLRRVKIFKLSINVDISQRDLILAGSAAAPASDNQTFQEFILTKTNNDPFNIQSILVYR